ncbi:MAG: hypothetical protein AAF717_00245 [Bacteroidota bacterium]
MTETQFKKAVAEILGDDGYTLSSSIEKKQLTAAKVNLNRPVMGWEVDALKTLAKENGFDDVEVTRSGAGLRVTFWKDES